MSLTTLTEPVELTFSCRFSQSQLTVYSQVGYKLLCAEAHVVEGNVFNKSPAAAELGFLQETKNVYWFSRLNVPRRLRGLGYGRQLLRRFLSTADENNVSILCFPSSSDPAFSNDALASFYTRNGFRAVKYPDILFYSPNSRRTVMPTPVAPRNLSDVLNRMFEIAPELREPLASTQASSQYAAPEMQAHWWGQAATILNQVGTQHPKAEQLMKIFGGQE